MLRIGKLSLLLLLILLSAAPSEAIVPVCVDPPSGLVSWWKGEDNADDSAGGNHGIIYGASFEDGMVGRAFSFDGNSYVEASDEGLPLGSAERTIVAWVYPTAYNYGMNHIVHYGSRGSGKSWGLVIKSDGELIAHEWYNYEGAGDVPLNQWSHVAISLSNGVKKHYINGSLVGESNYSPNTVSSGILRIGARIDNPYDPPELFAGLVDEVAVFNRALTDEEIAAIYNAGNAGMCSIQQDNMVVLQPGPGSNDGSDDGSANKGKDSGLKHDGGNAGNWQYMYIYNSPCNVGLHPGYLQFSTENMPTSNIAKAEIMLYVWVFFNGNGWPWPEGTYQLSLRKVTSPWNEMTVTLGNQPSYDSEIIDFETFTTVGGWGNPYTEFQGWMSFDITELYKGWVNGTIPNHGVVITLDNEICANGDELLIYSSDSTDDPSLRPKLVVTLGSAHTLTVNKAGSGSGTVTSEPEGINCGSDCSESYSAESIVNLTAIPSEDSFFAGWSGDCSHCGSNSECQITMDSDKTCTATFTRFTPISQCQEITSGGFYRLEQDLTGTINWYCLRISASDVLLEGNGFSITTDGRGYGIYVSGANNVTVENLTVSNNYYGISLYYSNNNTITNVTASNNRAGILLSYSNNNSISSSNLINNGIYIFESYNNTVTNTTVNGKPLVYLENAENLEVNGSSNAGQVILVNCSNMTVKDVILNNATAGVQVWNSENIKVTNITASNNQGSGIQIVKSSNITVAKSEIRSNNFGEMGSGINIGYSSNITVSESIVTNNKYYGLEIYNVQNLTLQNNQIVDNCGGIAGANLYYVTSGLITGNNVSENTGNGLALYGSEDLEIRENRISDNNYDGILLHYSSNNIIEKNEIQNNSIGISLHHSDSNRIIGNRIYDSRYSDSGIHLHMSNSNLIEGNRIWNNTEGLTIISSSGNQIYNNHFNNTQNVTIYDSQQNAWNITKTAGKNIFGGNYLGGNYWGSPDGNGFSDICTDGDGDGICDQPFVIDENNTDQLPLTKPAPPPTPTPTPTPTPAAPRPIGGGGGGGSYITGSGVYQTALETVKAGESHEIALPQSVFWDTGVFAVIVKPEDSVNIRFRIEKLKDLPVEITNPTGMIAAWSIKPTMSKYTSASGKIVFGISIQEIKAMGFDPSLIAVILMKWDGSKWIELPTSFVSSDGKYNYYEAETPSFSYFAAVIKAAPKPTPTPTTPPPTTPPVTTPPATTPAEKPLIPGFEAALAVAGLIVLAYLRKRKS